MTEIKGQKSEIRKTTALGTMVLALCSLLLAPCSKTQAQQQAKLPKIGFLGTRPDASAIHLKELQQELSVLGHVEGKDIIIESRYWENKPERLQAMADELVRLKVDVLLTPGTPAALAVKKATQTIPIVFYFVGDPVAVGLVDSLARPGGNITGFTIIAPVLAGKRLELLRESIPKLTSVALLWNPRDRSSAQQWKESQLPARQLGLELH